MVGKQEFFGKNQPDVAVNPALQLNAILARLPSRTSTSNFQFKLSGNCLAKP